MSLQPAIGNQVLCLQPVSHIRLILKISLELRKTTYAMREDTMVARETITSVDRHFRRVWFGLFAVLAILGPTGQASAAEAAKPAERFEVTSVKAAPPALVDSIPAVQRRDLTRA